MTNATTTAVSYDENDPYKQTCTPIETPAMIAEKLEEMKQEIENLPKKEKKNCLMFADRSPELTCDEFKLAFLRCEVFDAHKAAHRWANYWTDRLKAFGPERAFLPITLDSGALDDKDLAVLKMGQLQSAGEKDEMGRIVLQIHYYDQHKCKAENLTRAGWYVLHTLLQDEEVQKQGMVCFFKPVHLKLSAFSRSPLRPLIQSFRGSMPIRLAGVHVMDPPYILVTVFRIIYPFLGERVGGRMIAHFKKEGWTDDMTETYGLRLGQVPTMFGGTLELDFDKWLQERVEVERTRKAKW